MHRGAQLCNRSYLTFYILCIPSANNCSHELSEPLSCTAPLLLNQIEVICCHSNASSHCKIVQYRLCFSKQLSIYQKLVIIFHLLDKCLIKFSCPAFTVIRRLYFCGTFQHQYQKGSYTLLELPGSISQLSCWMTASLASHDDNDPLHYYPALQFIECCHPFY